MIPRTIFGKIFPWTIFPCNTWLSNLGHVGCRRSLAFGAVNVDMDAQDVDVDAEVEVEDAEWVKALSNWQIGCNNWYSDRFYFLMHKMWF